MTSNKQHLNESMLRPNTKYKTPEEVIDDKALSNQDKIEVLKNWADSITQKLDADAENMYPEKGAPHDEELLRKITSCMEYLKT